MSIIARHKSTVGALGIIFAGPVWVAPQSHANTRNGLSTIIEVGRILDRIHGSALAILDSRTFAPPVCAFDSCTGDADPVFAGGGTNRFARGFSNSHTSEIRTESSSVIEARPHSTGGQQIA
ncbi:hypothetical protein ABTW96_33210 [Nocardia beijingensis]|uniref:hypothetical protein n=1 Tax=Nocardia beijingensis TaxID=95162 RepID=UPI00331F0A46